MNKARVKVGVAIIIAGVALSALGLVEKISYENCLQMESGMLCWADPKNRFLFAALPVGIAGILICVMGIKDLAPFKSSKTKIS